MDPTQSHELIRTLTNIEKQLERIADALELKNIPDGEVIYETPDPYVQQFIHGRAEGPIESLR